MRHAIDPKIDCVFKALLGSEDNLNLLQHFLNAILAQELVEPLVSVELMNPIQNKETLSDKLSVVDVKAKDNNGCVYQIEIQLCNHKYLPERIVYNWADIYAEQLKSGHDYQQLKPTYSIWLLAENLITDQAYGHHYKLRDESGNGLVEHGGIWLLELKKFNISTIETESQRWLKFFKDGESLNDQVLPDWMNTLEMKQAMSTLSLFSEKEREYFTYQARQEFLRVQRVTTGMLEETEKNLAETKQTLTETELALIESQKREADALAELARLKAELEQK